MPSDRASILTNRLAWAKLHLKRAGLVMSETRGMYRITERGQTVLRDAPQRITLNFLARFPEYAEFRKRIRAGASDESVDDESPVSAEERPPDEQVLDGYERHRAAIAEDLLSRIGANSPAFFEQLVVELLQRMGYGAWQPDAGQVVGRSGDGGIDGIIRRDKLGLESVYVQAKRWQGSVGPGEIQQFAGALQGKRARHGVFITTSDFTKAAVAYAGSIPGVVLVNGVQLADLMMDYGLGVSVQKELKLLNVDVDYFAPE